MPRGQKIRHRTAKSFVEMHQTQSRKVCQWIYLPVATAALEIASNFIVLGMLRWGAGPAISARVVQIYSHVCFPL